LQEEEAAAAIPAAEEALEEWFITILIPPMETYPSLLEPVEAVLLIHP
jgi:hypothetical protein